MTLIAPDTTDAERSRSPSPTPLRASPTPNQGQARDGSRWNERESKHTTQPSRDVIILGLDPDVDAEKLRHLITSLADMVQARLAPPPQDVTVIRDRNTGLSKGFGFVKFDTLEDAKRFVFTHAPFIHNAEQWLGPAANPAMRRKRIKIDFSNSERPQGGISYYEQHNAPNSKEQLKRARARRGKSEESDVPEQMDHVNENAGLREASAAFTEMVLLTQVPAHVSPEDMGVALQEVTPRVEQVLLLRDRATKASTGRMMAVYPTADAAHAALAVLRNRMALPHGILGREDQPPIRTSFADPVVLEEADAFDPTSAPWVFVDRDNKTWRYEDERMGFDVWVVPATPSENKSRAPSPAAVPVPVAPVVPAEAATAKAAVAPAMVAQGTTFFMPTMSTAPHALLRLLNFADVPRRVCLLCQRQFKTAEMLARHGNESALHQTNLNDELTCRAGAARVLANASVTKENQVAESALGADKATPMPLGVQATRQVLGCAPWPADNVQGVMAWTAQTAAPLVPTPYRTTPATTLL